MLACPLCDKLFDQNEHVPVVGVFFSSQTICLACSKNKPPRQIDGHLIKEDYIVNYTIKEIIEMYSVQNAPVIELKQQLEEKRHQQERMEGELKLLIEKKASLLEEITSLQGMRKDEEPSCSEWDLCMSCNIFTNAEKLLNCLDCNDSKAICATCILNYHKHVEEREEEKKTTQTLDKTIELDMSIMSLSIEGKKSPNLSDSAIYLDSDHPLEDSIIILD